jgi:hypothetical protein
LTVAATRRSGRKKKKMGAEAQLPRLSSQGVTVEAATRSRPRKKKNNAEPLKLLLLLRQWKHLGAWTWRAAAA